MLTGLYLAVLALATVSQASRLVVGIALLVVTFNPVRRAARSIADRVAYGRRASSYEVLADFSDRMAEAYATDDVLPRMAAILVGSTGARSATVWLHLGGELVPAATTGDEPPSLRQRGSGRVAIQHPSAPRSVTWTVGLWSYRFAHRRWYR